MIGKHVVIDTLDNFKAKLDLIPSSAIVLIKDVGQIYAHGTYFGAQKTYSLLTKTADGLAPKGGTSASSLISDVNTEWVLTVTNGENPTWRKLPANAFSSSSYTLPSATVSDLGGIKVGQVYTATFNDLVGLYYKVNIDKNGLAYVHVPWVNNPYTASGSGITLKDNVFSLSLLNSDTKLDSAIGNKIYAVSLDKNGKLCVSVPWTDTNNIFVGATETKNGSSGMVPAPIANQHNYFLRGDGTWVKPNLSDLNDDVVNGKYLPLSGGTISNSDYGALNIERKSNDGFSGIVFTNWSGINGYLGVGGSLSSFPKQPMFVNSSFESYQIWHSGTFNPSDYLPLSGGIMNGWIYFKDKSLQLGHNDNGYFEIFNARASYCGLGLWDNGAVKVYTNSKWNDIIHSGNISSQSVSYASNAGAVEGLPASHLGNWFGAGDYDLNEIRDGFRAGKLYGASNTVNATSRYRGFLEYGANGYIAQFNSDDDNNLYYRWCENKTWGNWRTVAFEDSNVASATKLKTARTIWGKSFDGTGNVNGVLTLGNSRITGNDGADILNSEGKWCYLGAGTSEKGFPTYIDGHTIRLRYGTEHTEVVRISSSGNVGIGTTTPEYKLHVVGSVAATSSIVGGYSKARSFHAGGGETYAWIDSRDTSGKVKNNIILYDDRTSIKTLTPHGDNTYSLGTSSLRWSNIYGVNANLNGYIWLNTGDPTLKIYSGKITDGKSDGNICFLTCINGADGLSHSYAVDYQSRCNIVLQPRGGLVYIGTNPDGGNTSYKLYVNGNIYGSYFANSVESLKNHGGLTAVSGTTTMPSGLRLYSVYNNGYPCTYGNVLRIGGGGSGELVCEWTGDSSLGRLYYRSKRNVASLAWSVWGAVAWVGESYTKSEADSRFINASGDTMTGTLYIGDSKHYLQYYTGGKYVELYNVTAATGIGVWDTGEAKVFNSNGLYKIWHEGNDGSDSGLNADLLDGYHEYSFLRYRNLGSNGGATLWSQIGIRSYHNALPEGLSDLYNYGQVVSLPGSGSRLDIFTNHVGSSESEGLGGLWWRSGWNDDKKTWRRIIDSGNISSQSVSYASSSGNANTVDNYHISVTSSAGTDTSTIYFVT